MAIGVIIGFRVVCLSMYMAVLQRTREIGILKSLGASQVYILRIIPNRSRDPGIGGTFSNCDEFRRMLAHPDR